MRRSLLISVALAAAVSSCSSCPDQCLNTGTQVHLVRRVGDFGVPGDQLRFRVATDLGVSVTDCTMVAAGKAECTNTGVTASVAQSTGGRIREIVLAFPPRPQTITVTVLHVSGDSVVAGPASSRITYPSDEGACSCPAGQSIRIEM